VPFRWSVYYLSCCNIIRECIERARRQRRKITRNVLASERELRIERFMTAGFATRPLGEVGGVSRNRLLVDKMIVWRTILGLIMASKWPAPALQSACRFSNDRSQGLVIQRKQNPAKRAPTPRIPGLDFVKWVPPPKTMRRIAKTFFGASPPSSIARIGRSGRGFPSAAAANQRRSHNQNRARRRRYEAAKRTT
jgi:hypothetical protein